jgi:archaeal flagellar protein FlaJ
MIDDLKQNVDTEIEILREISNNIKRKSRSSPSERKLLDNSIASLRQSAKMINESLPKLLDEISINPKLPRNESVNKELQNVEFKRLDSKVHVTLKVEDRDKFLRQLSINEDFIRKFKKSQDSARTKSEEVKSARLYYKLSNKFFLNKSIELVNKGYFNGIYTRLKKANIDVLLSSYVAGIFFAVVISFFVSIFLMIFFTFFKLTTESIILIGVRESISFMNFIKLLWMPIVIPAITYFLFYYFPTSEKDSLEKKIEQELPFAVIQMGAISSSGIEPSEIFKIIMVSDEYPYLRKEIRKVLNQINIYGYDLVTALKNVSRTTPSTKLAELFSGLSVTITSGGELSTYFEKRAESLLLNYRLEREKSTRAAETFMDIYISVVIAAPMILMVLMVMMQISNFGPSLSGSSISLIVAVINILFLIVLDIRQPTY